MNRAKYIIFQQPNGSYFATSFSATVDHSAVAELYKQWNYKVHSAGVLTLYVDADGKICPSCAPGSTTLGIPLNMDKASEDETIMSIFLIKQ